MSNAANRIGFAVAVKYGRVGVTQKKARQVTRLFAVSPNLRKNSRAMNPAGKTTLSI